MKAERYLVSEEKGCKLFVTRENGVATWDMYSPKTGTHSINTEVYDKRVAEHWKGFLENQPKEFEGSYWGTYLGD